MATSTPITGAPTRAPAIPFPDLDPLETASELLEVLGGSLGVLGAYLETLENIGSDTPLAAYAAGHIVIRVRSIIRDVHEKLMAYGHAAGWR